MKVRWYDLGVFLASLVGIVALATLAVGFMLVPVYFLEPPWARVWFFGSFAVVFFGIIIAAFVERKP